MDNPILNLKLSDLISCWKDKSEKLRDTISSNKWKEGKNPLSKIKSVKMNPTSIEKWFQLHEMQYVFSSNIVLLPDENT